MCHPKKCRACGKTTWAGCGQHIATVKAGVPAGQWCPGGHSSAEKTAAAGSASRAGFFGRLFGRFGR